MGIMNAINVISPYKHHGMWVFDDAGAAVVVSEHQIAPRSADFSARETV
jgi:hypothetical protein